MAPAWPDPRRPQPASSTGRVPSQLGPARARHDRRSPAGWADEDPRDLRRLPAHRPRRVPVAHRPAHRPRDRSWPAARSDRGSATSAPPPATASTAPPRFYRAMAGLDVRGQPPRAVPDAQRRRRPGAPARPGRHLGRRRVGRQPARGVAGARPRRDPARVLGAGRRPRRGLGGSICWHVGGPTDSYGPTLRPALGGLGLLPYGNGVHYDSEDAAPPLLHQLVADEMLPHSYATDDGVGLVYEGTELVEAVVRPAGRGRLPRRARPRRQGRRDPDRAAAAARCGRSGRRRPVTTTTGDLLGRPHADGRRGRPAGAARARCSSGAPAPPRGPAAGARGAAPPPAGVTLVHSLTDRVGRRRPAAHPLPAPRLLRRRATSATCCRAGWSTTCRCRWPTCPRCSPTGTCRSTWPWCRSHRPTPTGRAASGCRSTSPSPRCCPPAP